MNRFVLFVLAVLVTNSGSALNSNVKVLQCLDKYIPKIEKYVESEYITRLWSYANETDYLDKLPKATIVLDIGLGSMWHSEVFYHMVQLNISGFDQHQRSSSNCHFDTIKARKASARDSAIENSTTDSYLYAHGHNPFLPRGDTWLKVLKNYPKVVVLMNDIKDKDYYNNMHSSSCRPEFHKDLQEHCFVPLLSVPFINMTSERYLLSSFELSDVKVMIAAYKQMIKCMVLAKNMWTFNLNTMPAVEYWSKLVSFLKIDVGGGAGAGGGAVGVKYLSEGGTVCDSVSMRTDARHAKRVQCADEYASRMASIHGSKYSSYARDMLLRSPKAVLRSPEDTNRLVLGIGPGSSDTRTIHFAVTLLQVTSLHFQSLFALSPLRKNLTLTDFNLDMKVLEKESPEKRVFWSDSPVPSMWWYIYKMYPNTNFMMADVRNDTLWWEKRRFEHCNGPIKIQMQGCIAPVPFRYDKSILAMEFFRLIQIKLMSADTNHRMYDAYRELVRCIVPSDKLWWVYLPELTSEEFWTKLISLVGAQLTEKQKNEYITKGIPRCGLAGCYWNGTKHHAA